MTISNNNQHQSVYYSVSCGNSVDCGDLGPGDETILPYYDDKPQVKVTLMIAKTGDATTIIVEDPGL
jgi:hypothetical protein